MIKIYGLLLLSLLLILVVPTSYRTQLVAAYAQVDFSILDSDNGMHSQVIAGIIFDIFTRAFEHSIEIDADQIFPNETFKHEIISKPGSFEFTMPSLNYNLLGFNISATDIEVVANAKQITDDTDQKQKTRIDFPVMLARNVNVTNGITNQNFNDVDLSSTYAIYDPTTDKFKFQVPFEIAARYLLK
ncbi:MAG: hypothetical protein WAM26_01745 [Nitrososphaeraceae archaeon]